MNLGESLIIGEQPCHSEYTRRFSAGCRNLHLQHLHHFRCGAHADPSLGMPSCQSKCRVHYGKSSRIEAVANRQPQIRVPHVPTLGHGFPQGSESQNREIIGGGQLSSPTPPRSYRPVPTHPTGPSTHSAGSRPGSLPHTAASIHPTHPPSSRSIRSIPHTETPPHAFRTSPLRLNPAAQRIG